MMHHQKGPRTEADAEDEQVGEQVRAEELGAVEQPADAALGLALRQMTGDATESAQTQASDTGDEGGPLDAVPLGPRRRFSGAHRGSFCRRGGNCLRSSGVSSFAKMWLACRARM